MGIIEKNPQKVKKPYEIIVSHPCTTYYIGRGRISGGKTETILDEKVTVYGYYREALSKATDKIMQYKNHPTAKVRIYDVEKNEFLT